MLLEHQAELLLLLHPRHLFAEPRSQIRVIDFSIRSLITDIVVFSLIQATKLQKLYHNNVI